MTDMLERAARAACIYDGLDPDQMFQPLDSAKLAPRWKGYQQIVSVALEAAFQVDDKDAKVFFRHKFAQADWHVNEYLGRRFCDGMRELGEELERTA